MSTDEEQQKYLNDALKVVREQAFFMKRACDGDSLKLALDHATEMLRELRTNLLTSKNYYELWMKVLDELRDLEEYLHGLQRSGRYMVEIYEQVQSIGNIVPRLYLMICVGGVYISSLEAPAKDILKDLVEMVKGVQHPIRGLFLRNYLTQVSKNRLPDHGSVYEGVGGNVQDAISFILQNFAETNRLWVRLQTQGIAKDRKKREKERLDLRILVGANLVRLSQLEGLEINDYKTIVLPKLLEEVISCKDTIAQNYLMDCIIQIFSDEFHFATLNEFLNVIINLKEKVNIKNIIELLMNRLANYINPSPSSGQASSGQTYGATHTEINSFKLFNDIITQIIEIKVNYTLNDSLKLLLLLINYSLKINANKIEYITHCLSVCLNLIEKSNVFPNISEQATSTSTTTEVTYDSNQLEIIQTIELILKSPLNILSLRVLEISVYGKLLNYLPYNNHKELALNLVQSIVNKHILLNDFNQIEILLQTIKPLLEEKPGTVIQYDEDGKEISNTQTSANNNSISFELEQSLIAKLIHLITNEDTDILLQIYNILRKYFLAGGSARMKHTLPSLIFNSLNLVKKVKLREILAENTNNSELNPKFSTRKVFHFVIEVITTLSSQENQSELSLKLFLIAAQSADSCQFHAIAYEFIKEALLIYETDIIDSKSQVKILHLIIGTLLNCKSFPMEDYEALITKIAQYSNKLLKKIDQVRLITLCSHLFWPPMNKSLSASGTVLAERYNDPERVLECLQRALKIASVSNTDLFVEILDRYLYNYENDNPAIHVRYLSGLIALINEQLATTDGTGPNLAVRAHYKNTIEYIRNRQNNLETSEKYNAITL